MQAAKRSHRCSIRPFYPALLVLAACAGDGTDGDRADDTGKGDDTGASTLPWVEDFDGDLGDGEIIELSWAWDAAVACWPGNEDANFTGTHQFFVVEQPPQSLLTATVSPDNDVDANIYLLQFGGDVQVPPAVTGAVSCEAGYPQSTDSNPGQSDSASVTALSNGYTVLVGIAGAEGHHAGAFSGTLDFSEYP